MAGIRRRFSILALGIAGLLLLSACENALFNTVKVIIEESVDPLRVSFQPSPGTYTTPQTVLLSANKDGATIRYTTDGSEPTTGTGYPYTGPISVSASATIKARAFKEMYSDSEVALGEFAIPFGGQVKRYSLTPGVGDQFGLAVAIDGDYAIVGAPFEAGAGTERGAAYIFHRTGPDTWDAGVRLEATNVADGQRFGYAVAIDGDYAIVGNGEVYGRSSAYIFYRTGLNTWDTGVKIDPPAVILYGFFGYAVAVSGDYAVVGAFGEIGGGTGTYDRAGASYIFRRTGLNSWTDRFEINAFNGMADDNFGRSVAIDGDYVIVGAPNWDALGPSPPQDVGTAYIYNRTGTNTWDGGERLLAGVIQASANFGWSVDISGDYAIAGAENEDEGLISFAGAAYVFHRIATNTWELGDRLTASDPQTMDYFGSEVAISGSYALGAAKMEDAVANGAGAVYSFYRTATNTWDAGPTAKWTAFDGGELEFFGCSIGMDGMYAIVGAYGCDGPGPKVGAGAAYILH
jgi:hypothetical protein